MLAAYAAQAAEIEKVMTAPGAPDFVGGSYGWPVPGFDITTSHFGMRTFYGRDDYHTGIDIADEGIEGADVVAAGAGTVIKVAQSATGYGNYLVLDHGGGEKTLYAHLGAVAVAEGEAVASGQRIAAAGSSGDTSAPLLHFELWQNGQPVDPLTALASVIID